MSYRRLIVFLLPLFFWGSCYTSQNLSKSINLKPGMSKYDVSRLLGHPIKTDFSGNVEEWHYCKTDFSADEFLALFFFEEKLIEKVNYTVTVKEAKGYGDCSKFIKRGSYKEPDSVRKIKEDGRGIRI